MVVAARIQYLMGILEQGAKMVVTSATNPALQHQVLTIHVYPSVFINHYHQTFVQATLRWLLESSRSGVVADRGHKHSDGHSVVKFVVKGRGSISHGASEFPGGPPSGGQDDDDAPDDDFGGSPRSRRHRCAGSSLGHAAGSQSLPHGDGNLPKKPRTQFAYSSAQPCAHLFVVGAVGSWSPLPPVPSFPHPAEVSDAPAGAKVVEMAVHRLGVSRFCERVVQRCIPTAVDRSLRFGEACAMLHSDRASQSDNCFWRMQYEAQRLWSLGRKTEAVHQLLAFHSHLFSKVLYADKYGSLSWSEVKAVSGYSCGLWHPVYYGVCSTFYNGSRDPRHKSIRMLELISYAATVLQEWTCNGMSHI